MSDIRELLEWDWAYTEHGDRLHHVSTIERETDYGQRSVEGVTTCGIATTLFVPGLFSRMGMERCRPCCRKLGLPEGTGSPKNDDSLRPWVEARLAAATEGVTP